MNSMPSDRREGAEETGGLVRLRMTIRGFVQGVGFRPFVYRLAADLGLNGWVCNSSAGVHIELDGDHKRLEAFVKRLNIDSPPQALIHEQEIEYLPAAGFVDFSVRQSDSDGNRSALVLPDLGMCPDCLDDIRDPANRRFRYPFTNCTNCGPRYSIIQALPYDRSRTTMHLFPMCDACRAEYENPADRRFHAQPNACAACGPHLELWNTEGRVLALYDGALREACEIVREGGILALKGLGGFQLIVDAANEDAVMRLRRRKAREEKPLALMYPDLDTVEYDCRVSPIEREILCSRSAPIILLRRRAGYAAGSTIAPSVAPDNPTLGVMLPYTPLHYLLMSDLGFPVVATSGNISDEPICIDEGEAAARLGHIADAFLIHNRPIARQVDDSVIQVIEGDVQVLRNARGYAPSHVMLPDSVTASLALGAHLKNSIAIADGNRAFLSQHIGDLDTPQARAAMSAVIHSLGHIYAFEPKAILCDKHPDYASTRLAEEYELPTMKVQHHYAHVLAGMIDNHLDSPVLGVAWDGTGAGDDGTIWGGEFLTIGRESYSRTAHLAVFGLPGGEKAVKEPRRCALSVLYELCGHMRHDKLPASLQASLSEEEALLLFEMIERRINCPLTSSAGRLFDAVSSLLGLKHINIYEGQAAMLLGFAAEGATETEKIYNYIIDSDESGYIIDWKPIIKDIMGEIEKNVPVNEIAAVFHNTLADSIVAVAGRCGERKVLLTGGCFQNRYLTRQTIGRLRKAGFEPFWHHRIPPNDGGIAVGQIAAALRSRKGQV